MVPPANVDPCNGLQNDSKYGFNNNKKPLSFTPLFTKTSTACTNNKTSKQEDFCLNLQTHISDFGNELEIRFFNSDYQPDFDFREKTASPTVASIITTATAIESQLGSASDSDSDGEGEGEGEGQSRLKSVKSSINLSGHTTSAGKSVLSGRKPSRDFQFHSFSEGLHSFQSQSSQSSQSFNQSGQWNQSNQSLVQSRSNQSFDQPYQPYQPYQPQPTQPYQPYQPFNLFNRKHTMSDLSPIHKTASNSSRSSAKNGSNGAKKLMMGIGNKFSNRKLSNSIPKEEEDNIIHEELIHNPPPPVPSLDIPGLGSAGDSSILGFDFDNDSFKQSSRYSFGAPRLSTNFDGVDDGGDYTPSSPNSIQPSPVLDNGGFDIMPIKKSTTMPVMGSLGSNYEIYSNDRVNDIGSNGTTTATGSSTSTSSSVTTVPSEEEVKKDSSKLLLPARSSKRYSSSTNLSGLGFDIPLNSPPKAAVSVPRIKKAFNSSYAAIDSTPQSTSLFPEIPSTDNNYQSSYSSISPNKDNKIPSKITYSKKLVFSNIDEVANKDSIYSVPLKGADTINTTATTNTATTTTAATTDPRYSYNLHNDSDSDFENETLLPFAVSPSQNEYVYPKSIIPNHPGKVMTKSQFDHYRKSIVGLSNLTDNDNNSRRGNDEDDDDDDDLDNDRQLLKHLNDDPENKKESLRMRLKQDAHLSVYRQKMTKISTSHSSANLASFQSPAGGPSRFSSSNNLPAMAANYLPNGNSNGYIGDLDMDDEDMDDDEYDDVPLGILKAHGFPSGPAKLIKHMQSQPSLSEHLQQPPSVLYQSRQSDAMSLNSGYSGVLPSSNQSIMAPPLPISMPPEGELLVKPVMTNDIFGNPTTHMNRGLIGEIAREEEAKLKRRSYGNLLSAQRSQTMVGGGQSGYAGSLYNGFGGGQSNSPPPQATNASSSNEIQQQLQQVMQMQMQMLQQIQGGGGAPTTAMPPPQQRKQHMSSFDLIRQSSSMPFSPRPPSIRSVAMSDRSLEVGKSPYLRNTISQGRFSPALQFGVRPASSMNLANNNIHQPDEDEDEEEDDKGWKEMLEKRRQLKEMWKQQSTSVALVS